VGILLLVEVSKRRKEEGGRRGIEGRRRKEEGAEEGGRRGSRKIGDSHNCPLLHCLWAYFCWWR
jgi:hypothetical protein